MKKSLARKITLSILAGAVLMSSSVVWAATAPSGWISRYDGSNDYYTPPSATEGVISSGGTYDVRLAGTFSSTGDVTGGKITITGGTFDNPYVSGGYTTDGNAIGNEVFIGDVSNSIFHGFIIGGNSYFYGDTDKSREASGNKVIIDATNAIFERNVYGGNVNITGQSNANIAVQSNANKNTVTINAGTFKDDIYGGNASNGSADGNIVEINGGEFTGSDVYGGYANDGNASNNTVSISNGVATSTFGQVYGGVASGTIGGEASNNTVIIDVANGTFKDAIYGGYGYNDNANGNTVTINGGTFDDSIVMGGYAYEKGNANNNMVSISEVEDHSAFGNVYGGQAFTWTVAGDASKNTVIINAEKGGFKSVFGGSAYVGNANENTVIISNGTFEDSIYGGSTNNGSADGNTVNIKGGTFNHTVSDVVYGGYATNGSASNNTVSISGVNGDFDIVKGGYADNTSTAGDASNNTVIINAEDGIFKGSIWGGDTRIGNANKNTVIISNGTFEDPIYGGYATNGNASNNTVTINGGTFNGVNIYGGYVGGTGKEAVNNTVNIGGNATLDNDVNIRGGIVNNANPYYGGSASPNTLNLNGWQNNDKSVGLIAGFDVINFNDCKWEDGKTVVQTVDFSFDSDLKINVNGMTTDKVPNVYDEMTLVKSGNAMSEVYKTSRATFMASGYERVIGEVYQKDNKNINLKVNKVSANEQILAIGESRAAASALTNQGSELIETGLDALARDNDKDTKVFAALYGNASEYETGSHVKVNGWNGIVGVGKTNANGVTMGAFFENGEGNYRTFNEYEGEFMHGDGEATYNGGGFLYRKDTASGVYTEASLRAGNLQNELRNAVIANDQLAGYDIDTFYYGAHVGIGKVIPRGNEGDSIDVYGKFIYTHYDDEDFTIDGGKFHLDSIESKRLRLGFRINEVQNNKLNMYYGAAWEYEFGGDSNNSVVGYDIDVNAPSLEGSTVIGEIGMHYKASEKWSLDLNGRAYVGQREGFSGSVQANYSF